MHEQPNQKMFETKLFKQLMEFNKKDIVWVESESIKIGKLNIPSKLWKKMGVGINIKLKSTVKERVKFILKD